MQLGVVHLYHELTVVPYAQHAAVVGLTEHGHLRLEGVGKLLQLILTEGVHNGAGGAAVTVAAKMAYIYPLTASQQRYAHRHILAPIQFLRHSLLQRPVALRRQHLGRQAVADHIPMLFIQNQRSTQLLCIVQPLRQCRFKGCGIGGIEGDAVK